MTLAIVVIVLLVALAIGAYFMLGAYFILRAPAPNNPDDNKTRIFPQTPEQTLGDFVNKTIGDGAL